jgi:hypothetical protein
MIQELNRKGYTYPKQGNRAFNMKNSYRIRPRKRVATKAAPAVEGLG